MVLTFSLGWTNWVESHVPCTRHTTRDRCNIDAGVNSALLSRKRRERAKGHAPHRVGVRCWSLSDDEEGQHLPYHSSPQHPEVLEGPLHYLPQGWAQQASKDTASSSHIPADQQQLFSSLRRNKFFSLAERPGINLISESPAIFQRLSQVHGILFGLDGHGQEGFYSLRAFGADGIPKETIIVFEGREDAERYAGLLEATMEPHTPHVCRVPAAQLVTFCLERGYQCHCEPCGSLLIPPDCNVGLTDWERSRRLRNGSFAVLENEPHEPNLGGPTSHNGR